MTTLGDLIAGALEAEEHFTLDELEDHARRWTVKVGERWEYVGEVSTFARRYNLITKGTIVEIQEVDGNHVYLEQCNKEKTETREVWETRFFLENFKKVS